jgi:hypothetical protein
VGVIKAIGLVSRETLHRVGNNLWKRLDGWIKGAVRLVRKVASSARFSHGRRHLGRGGSHTPSRGQAGGGPSKPTTL